MRTPGLIPPPTVPSDGLDLAALHGADVAVRDAAAAARAADIAERLSDLLSAVDPATAGLARQLIAELGRVDARAAAAMQAAEEGRRGRGEWVALDPLRAGVATTHPPRIPPERTEVDPAGPDFRGFGWHEPEEGPDGGFRWSRHPIASVILPSLGAGVIEVRLDLVAPFGHPIRAADVTLLHDGTPLDFSLSKEGQDDALLTARITSGDEYALNPIVLVLSGPACADPTGAERRDLGLGLRKAVAQRL